MDYTSPEDVKSERALCAAVILMAINDLTKANIEKQHRNSAGHFIDGDNPMFQFYAQALGHDPHWLAKKIWKQIHKSQHKIPELSPYLAKPKEEKKYDYVFKTPD